MLGLGSHAKQDWQGVMFDPGASGDRAWAGETLGHGLEGMCVLSLGVGCGCLVDSRGCPREKVFNED